VLFEDVTDSRIRDMVTDVRKGALNAIVAPSRIVLSKAKYQIDDHLPDPWPTGLRVLSI